MTPELKDSLMATASSGDIQQIKTLLSVGQEPPSEKTIQELLTAAAKGSHLDIVNFFLDQYPSVALDEEIVRAAVNTGSIPVFRALLTRDPSVINMPFDRRGSPLIVACCGRQDVEYLRFLLEEGADPNQDPDGASFPLSLVAALYKDPDVIDLLLRHGARLEGSCALGGAAMLGNEAMLLRLLERGARIETDARDWGPKSWPLHSAVRAGHVGVVRILLSHGADPHARNERGFTAIDVAHQMVLGGKDINEMSEVLERNRI